MHGPIYSDVKYNLVQHSFFLILRLQSVRMEIDFDYVVCRRIEHGLSFRRIRSSLLNCSASEPQTMLNSTSKHAKSKSISLIISGGMDERLTRRTSKSKDR